MYQIIMIDTDGNAEHTATIGHKSNLLNTMLDFMHHHHEFESVVIRRYRPDTDEE